MEKTQMEQEINLENKENIQKNSNNKVQVDKEDPNINYYQETCKLYIANVVLTTQLKELQQDKNELLAKLHKLEVPQPQSLPSSLPSQKKLKNSTIQSNNLNKKRIRRGANEIERPFKCPIQNCEKAYGSEGSLTQHVKLKHLQFYQTIANNQNAKIEMLNNISENKLNGEQEKQDLILKNQEKKDDKVKS